MIYRQLTEVKLDWRFFKNAIFQRRTRYLVDMGFYSYTCAKTNLPIMASTSWGEDYSRVVVLGEDGSIIRGVYDGYGRVFTKEGIEVEIEDESVMKGRVKFVSASFYGGEKFSALSPSRPDPGQGHFHDEDKVSKWYSAGGFSTWDEYRMAYYGS
jgi:hypothetical protein